jgi:hypothetical protein
MTVGRKHYEQHHSIEFGWDEHLGNAVMDFEASGTLQSS